MFGTDITIQGGPFVEPTALNGILAKRMNIVYGRNGTGKSSIAKAFQEQQATGVRPMMNREYKLSFDKSGSFSPEVQSRLFVFNEKFIETSVKVESGGLKSIVRIGASAELDGPIQAAKDKIKDLEAKRKPYDDEIITLDGRKADSLYEADSKLKEGMKSGGFADRYQALEGKRLIMTGNTLAPIINTTITSPGTFSITDAAATFKDDLDRYQAYQDGALIVWRAPNLSGMPNLDEINAILEQSVRPAQLTAQEQTILDDLSSALIAENLIDKTQAWIVDGDRAYCPLCHQPISPEYKHELRDHLLRFRDRQVEEFKTKVAAIRSGIQFPDDYLPDIPGVAADLNSGRDALAALRGFITEICNRLDKKYATPFAPLESFDKNTLATLISDCRVALKKVADDVAEYNQALQEKEKLLDSLRKDSITLAIYENLHWILEYNKRTARKSFVDGEIERINNEIQVQKDAIALLRGKMDQIDEAREQINNYLAIIFGEKKLRLVNAGKDYQLQLKRGNTYEAIAPNNISSGERNALALAYFFACVLEKKEKDYQYSEPTLLVIDDPVSSFDADNKAGVISLLNLQCDKVLKGNVKSRVLVFTHDMATLRELCSHRSSLFPNDDWQTKKFLRIRHDRTLVPVNCSCIRDNMEYFNDLQSIYEFAEAADPEDYTGGDSMGNTIRSFAETFATRWYKCSWVALFSNDDLLLCLKPSLRDKIKAFAMRPVLNSESHGGEHSFELAEVQRAARVILVYLYYSNYEHLHAFLVGEKGDEGRMRKIEGWGGEF